MTPRNVAKGCFLVGVGFVALTLLGFLALMIFEAAAG